MWTEKNVLNKHLTLTIEIQGPSSPILRGWNPHPVTNTGSGRSTEGPGFLEIQEKNYNMKGQVCELSCELH